jgi:hypothetical protein
MGHYLEKLIKNNCSELWYMFSLKLYEGNLLFQAVLLNHIYCDKMSSFQINISILENF